MSLINLLLHQLRTVPEYFIALKGAVAVLAMGLPIYAGLRYFLYRRRLKASLGLTLGTLSIFILFAVMTFVVSSPLAALIRHHHIMRAYLFLTCLLTALTIVEIIDLFLIQHYLSHVKKMYVSPPLRTIIKLTIFCVSILPILHFVLHFNPLALVAIPTIASAGVAFALQDTLKAFIAGVGLGNIIRLGEWISFQDKEGRVIDLNWARTTLETVDGQRVYIPNNLLLSGAFLNYTTGNPSNRQSFKVSASYEASPARVKEALLNCARFVPGVAQNPPPQTALLEYSDSGILYGLFYWLVDYAQKQPVQDDVATRIWYAFRREGIAIPYPMRTVQIQKTAESAADSPQQIQDSLHQWNLAEAFYAEELQELSRWTRPCSYAPGEVIVHQGDEGHSLFVMVKGSVDILVAPNSDRPVATLGPREIFGEMSLLTGEARSATVRAKSAVELLEIQKAGLQKVIAKRPELSDRLAELVVKRRSDLVSLPPSGAAGGPDPESDRSLSTKIRHFFGLA